MGWINPVNIISDLGGILESHAHPHADLGVVQHTPAQPSDEDTRSGSPEGTANYHAAIGPYKPSIGERIENWWTQPHHVYAGTLGVPSESPQQRTHEVEKAVGAAGLIASAPVAPIETAAAGLGSAAVGYAGGKLGRWAGKQVGAPEVGQDIGELTGAVVGGETGAEIGGEAAGPVRDFIRGKAEEARANMRARANAKTIDLTPEQYRWVPDKKTGGFKAFSPAGEPVTIETDLKTTPKVDVSFDGPPWERQLAARRNGKIVGGVGYKMEPSGTAMVYGSVVSPEFRGQGVGTQMYEHIANDARAHGANRLVSDSTNMSPSAMGVWQKLIAKGYPVKPIVHANGKPGFEMDLSQVHYKTSAEPAPIMFGEDSIGRYASSSDSPARVYIPKNLEGDDALKYAQEKLELQKSFAASRAAKPVPRNAGVPKVAQGATEYNATQNRPPVVAANERVNPEFGARTADAYEHMTHEPQNPKVQRSYNALKQDIQNQWQFATQNMGITFEPWTQAGQPYADSAQMEQDVRDNHHLYFFLGGDVPADHPMAEVDPQTGLTYMQMLRGVHDLFGHAAHGNQFGPTGERNAYLDHAQMFSHEAIPALTTETHGQNSWVNFGPYLRNAAGEIPAKGQAGYIAPKERPFAEQKAGLLPKRFQSPATYHPDLQALADKYGITDRADNALKAGASFITPDGKFIPLSGITHPEAIEKLTGERPEEDKEALGERMSQNLEPSRDSRVRFLNETGAIRVRASNDRAGKTVHVSLPVDGATPEAMDALKRLVAQQGRYGNVNMERADATPETANELSRYKEFARPSDVESMLHEIGAHPEGAETPEVLLKKQMSVPQVMWRKDGFMLPDGSFQVKTNASMSHKDLAKSLGYADDSDLIRHGGIAIVGSPHNILFSVEKLDPDTKTKIKDLATQAPSLSNGISLGWGLNNEHLENFRNADELLDWLDRTTVDQKSGAPLLEVPPHLLGYESGGSTASTVGHEYGHALEAALTGSGMPYDGIMSHNHESMRMAEAMAGIPLGVPSEFTRDVLEYGRKGGLNRTAPNGMKWYQNILDRYLAGGMVEQEYYDFPWEQNQGTSDDISKAISLLEQAGVDSPYTMRDEIAASQERIKHDLHLPGMRDIFMQYAASREEGLSPEYHTSLQRLQDFIAETKGHYETQKGSQTRPTGVRLSETRTATPARETVGGERRGTGGLAERGETRTQAEGGEGKGIAGGAVKISDAVKELEAERQGTLFKGKEKSPNKAWIRPNGDLIPVERDESHADVAVREFGLLDKDDALDKGWIRKAEPGVYQVHYLTPSNISAIQDDLTRDWSKLQTHTRIYIDGSHFSLGIPISDWMEKYQGNLQNTLESVIPKKSITDYYGLISDVDLKKASPDWAQKAVDLTNESQAGAIDPRTGKVDTEGYGVEVYPEARADREPLTHNPTPADFQQFYDEHKDIFEKHPELRVGWDKTDKGWELNVGAKGTEAGAKLVGSNLDQRAAWDIAKQEEIPTGGKGEKTRFAKYPIEERIADLTGKNVKNLPADVQKSKHLTDDEKYLLASEPTVLKDFQKAQDFLEKKAPVDEIAATALMGQANRHWYARARASFNAMFDAMPQDFHTDEDRKKFPALVAATSPQSDPALNLRNALDAYHAWVDAGRPTDVDEVRKIVDPVLELGAHQANAARALTKQALSGPKVSSFSKNFAGHTENVTNDMWGAITNGMDPDEMGKLGTYIALSENYRKAADWINKNVHPDTKWTPEGAQAASWGFIRTLGYASGWKGQGSFKPPEAVVHLVDDPLVRKFSADIAEIMLTDEEVRDRLESLGINLEDFDAQLEQHASKFGRGQKEGKTEGVDVKHLTAAARKVERAKQSARVEAQAGRRVSGKMNPLLQQTLSDEGETLLKTRKR